MQELVNPMCKYYLNAHICPEPSGTAKRRAPPRKKGVKVWLDRRRRSYDVRRWTELPRGGHFATLEEPELLAEDIRAFFRPLRSS